jgi:hypothetical protein
MKLAPFFLICIVGGEIQGPFGTVATNGLLCQPRVIMMMGKSVEWLAGESTRRKPAPVPLCPPQTPHAARTRTRAATVGSQRLTAWGSARPTGALGKDNSKIKLHLQ